MTAEANGYIPLNIQPTCDRIKEILPLLEELIPIEKKLAEFGVIIELNTNHFFINISTKADIDLRL